MQVSHLSIGMVLKVNFIFTSPCTIEHEVLLHSFQQISTVIGKMYDPEVTKMSHIYTNLLLYCRN